LYLAVNGHSFQFNEVSAFPSADAQKDASRARAPVAGKVTQVLAVPGKAVTEGQQLLCVEAMKMEMWLCAQASGTVKAVHVNVGDQVESGALLVELEI
jgi:geranyl-CoA carboxylase alpha subunit